MVWLSCLYKTERQVSLFTMNKITQDMKFKQAVIEYSFKKASQQPLYATRPAERISTVGGRNMMELSALWQIVLTALTAIPISTPKQS